MARRGLDLHLCLGHGGKHPAGHDFFLHTARIVPIIAIGVGFAVGGPEVLLGNHELVHHEMLGVVFRRGFDPLKLSFFFLFVFRDRSGFFCAPPAFRPHESQPSDSEPVLCFKSIENYLSIGSRKRYKRVIFNESSTQELWRSLWLHCADWPASEGTNPMPMQEWHIHCHWPGGSGCTRASD